MTIGGSVLSALVFAALVAQSPSEEEAVARRRALTPTFSIDVKRDTVVITVHPPERLMVRWVVIDLPDSHSWAKPIKLETLAKRKSVQATFRHPHAAHAFVVMLDNNKSYRVRRHDDGIISVRLLNPPPSRRF